VIRDRPKFGFGFGAETDLKCSFCSVSVITPHFTFGFGRNNTADDRNWSALMDANLGLKPQCYRDELWDTTIIHAEYGDGRRVGVGRGGR